MGLAKGSVLRWPRTAPNPVAGRRRTTRPWPKAWFRWRFRSCSGALRCRWTARRRPTGRWMRPVGAWWSVARTGAPSHGLPVGRATWSWQGNRGCRRSRLPSRSGAAATGRWRLFRAGKGPPGPSHSRRIRTGRSPLSLPGRESLGLGAGENPAVPSARVGDRRAPDRARQGPSSRRRLFGPGRTQGRDLRPGPAMGAMAVPVFRALVLERLPSLANGRHLSCPGPGRGWRQARPHRWSGPISLMMGPCAIRLPSPRFRWRMERRSCAGNMSQACKGRLPRPGCGKRLGSAQGTGAPTRCHRRASGSGFSPGPHGRRMRSKPGPHRWIRTAFLAPKTAPWPQGSRARSPAWRSGRRVAAPGRSVPSIPALEQHPQVVRGLSCPLDHAYRKQLPLRTIRAQPPHPTQGWACPLSLPRTLRQTLPPRERCPAIPAFLPQGLASRLRSRRRWALVPLPPPCRFRSLWPGWPLR